jgi:sugar phosphate isomerase/epimerase
VCQLLDPRDLCIETLEALPFDVMLPLIEQHHVSICFDVGHLEPSGGSELDFLTRHAARIREVHLHDVDRAPLGLESRDHLPLGQGQLDYQAVLHKLEQSGYAGPVILENNNQADLKESLRQLQGYL